MITERLPNENAFLHKVRLCRAKLEKQIDLDWQEIVDILDLDVHYDTLRKSAYGLLEYDNYLHSKNSAAVKILSISDLHVPFQKPKEIFSDYVGRIDILQINGDVSDCQAISKFPKAYRISPMEELIETREYLIDLIEYLKPKEVVVTYGNHDLRFQSYFAKSLDSDLIELMPKTSLELIFVDGFKHYNKREGTKVEYRPLIDIIEHVNIKYTDNWFCQIGETIFCHPLAFSNSPMSTSVKAMDFFRNEGYNFKSLVMAHTHRVGEYKIGNTTLYEQGCCCESSKIHYADGRLTKSQKEGFLFLCQNKDGEVVHENSKLVCLN